MVVHTAIIFIRNPNLYFVIRGNSINMSTREPDYSIHFIIPPILFLISYFIFPILILSVISTIVSYIVFLLILNHSYQKFLKDYEPVPKLKYMYFQIRIFFTGQFIVQGMIKRQSSKINEAPPYSPKQPDFQQAMTASRYCPSCGNESNAADLFCFNCGNQLS